MFKNLRHFKLRLVGMLLGTQTYCPASDIGFFIGLWTNLVVFNCQVVE